MRKNLNDLIYGDRSVVNSNKYDSDADTSSWKSGKSYNSPRCYESHPPLKIPGTDFKIYGGSCLSPSVKDADVYIGFDNGMKFSFRHWPWRKGDEILFPIQDMGIPDSLDDFNQLIGWTKTQLEAGRKVHCGCIGGHGRTGTFFAALVASYGEKDAISYVRSNYCTKAVESSQQVDFLAKNFGVLKVKGHKESSSYSQPSKATKTTALAQMEYEFPKKSVKTYEPLPNRGCIFG